MNSIDINYPYRKDSKIIKTFDLKHLGMFSNSEEINAINFEKINNNLNQDMLNIRKESNSKNKGTNKEIKTPKMINEEEKIKYLINNKAISNTLTSNFFFQNKKSYILSEKAKLSESIKNNDSNRLEFKEKESKNNNLFFIDNGNKSNKNKDKYDSLPKFQKSNKKNFKKLFIINKKITEKPNYFSNFSKSVKNHITIQSTQPTFSNILSPKKDGVMKKKKELNTCKSMSIKKIKLNDFDNFKSPKDNAINDIKKYSALIKYRKNYPFILNPKPFLQKKFNGLPSSIIKMNNKYMNILKKENEKVFRQYFSIIGKEKFSKKFQNIVNKYEIKEKNEKKNKRKKINNKQNGKINESSTSDDSLVNENIISGTQLLKEIIQDEKKQKNIIIKRDKKILFYKFKKEMIFLHIKIEAMTVYFGDILTNYKKPKKSYAFKFTRDLFFAIKTKNFKLANNILDSNKYIVLDYDYFNMTALHWAAKYNFYQIIPKIIEYGSHVNKQDYIGNTPLLVCVKHNFIESTIFLLLYLASPFIKDNKGFNALDYCKTEFKMKNILQKIISLHYICILGPTKKWSEYISRKFLEYIVNENKGDLELEAYNIIKEKYEYYKRKNKNS